MLSYRKHLAVDVTSGWWGSLLVEIKMWTQKNKSKRLFFFVSRNPSVRGISWPPFQRSNGTYLSLKPDRYSTQTQLRISQCQYWKKHLKYPQPDNAGHLALQNFPGKVMWYFGNVLSRLSKFWTKVKSYSKSLIWGRWHRRMSPKKIKGKEAFMSSVFLF